MVKNLENLGYKTPTPIQVKTLPIILKKQDVLAKSKTGSGKTVAFGIPLILELNIQKRYEASAIVLAPSRELANQVARELRQLASFVKNTKILTLCGGTPMKGHVQSIKHGVHIVVGTPGRVLALLKKGSLDLNFIKTLVLDEADKMLDMGFFEDIEKIINYTPKSRQTLLFSATFDIKILEFSKSIQNNRVKIEIENEKLNIQERFFKFSNDGMERVIQHFKPQTCIIFCNTKIKCKELEKRLQHSNYDALSIHSDLEQIDRDETLLEFIHKSCTFLVATDVATRGLDIPNVDLVINYDLPQSKETYIHRIGRTGRMNKVGLAVSFARGHEEYLDVKLENIDSLHVASSQSYRAKMRTLCINGGKRDKIRAGDILGALVKEMGQDVEHIGKILINKKESYVSINSKFSKEVFEKIKKSKIKGKIFKVWILS
ncbi:MAG: ATP-dependent RNA helicase DbpA [Sulfurospirillum sp.]|nr:ATP-dependent RNA helicase DbpA [Sulfurospirillum sp.]MBL0703352.1 ATP-dependent RNA helicase DbpA [Sulfurospirillum sp.]